MSSQNLATFTKRKSRKTQIYTIRNKREDFTDTNGIQETIRTYLKN